jgi:hypothetical protein
LGSKSRNVTQPVANQRAAEEQQHRKDDGHAEKESQKKKRERGDLFKRGLRGWKRRPPHKGREKQRELRHGKQKSRTVNAVRGLGGTASGNHAVIIQHS